MSKNFYITTTLPYVNSEPHLGFAMEIIRADIIARSKKLQDFDVFFNTGTDEHGQKIYENAVSAGTDVKSYVDKYAESFKDLKGLLGLSDDLHFIRTTDEHHIKAAQAFWQKCLDNDDIYKKNYKVKYCIGCELEKQDSDLEDGKCPVHPNKELEIREEENYFFRFSKYQTKLLDLYAKNPNFVLPDFRFNEIKAFVERGLEDFSISRLKSKMPWGVPVPNDLDHVMYVWFDALVNYISTLGWPEDLTNYEKYWVNGTPVQYCGKDNLRQQSAMWQAMLMSAGLNPSNNIVINGFINAEDGRKMSKSLGNVVGPKEIIDEYGVDFLRYYVAGELSNFEDSSVSKDRLKEIYNAKFANGVGNLVSRIMKMASDNLSSPVSIAESENMEEYFVHLNNFEISKAVGFIWEKISELDSYIQNNQPFKVIKTDKEAGEKMVTELAVGLYSVARILNPIMPETSTKIKELIKANKTPSSPLFVRKD
ncbi:MAG: methionine--tRNA ligase [Patescibacteria group bacterium]